jgi:hypothetical protein
MGKIHNTKNIRKHARRFVQLQSPIGIYLELTKQAVNMAMPVRPTEQTTVGSGRGSAVVIFAR